MFHQFYLSLEKELISILINKLWLKQKLSIHLSY